MAGRERAVEEEAAEEAEVVSAELVAVDAADKKVEKECSERAIHLEAGSSAPPGRVER